MTLSMDVIYGNKMDRKPTGVPLYEHTTPPAPVYPPVAVSSGKETETTLQEIADILHCSRRHVRSLLSSMQTAGWLSWQAETGRGKRSRLCFLQSGRDLQHARAEQLIEQDNIENWWRWSMIRTRCARWCYLSWSAASGRGKACCVLSITALL